MDYFHWIKKEYDSSAMSIGMFEKLFLYGIDFKTSIPQDLEVISLVSEDGEVADELRDVIHGAIDGRMKMYPYWDLGEEDGPALFDISLYHRSFDCLKEVVIPIAEKPFIHTGFLLSFLKALHQSIKRGQVPQDEAKLLYERVARKAVLSMNFASPTTPESSSYLKYERPLVTNILEYNSMLEFISTLVTFQLDELLWDFSLRIDTVAKHIREQAFESFWIPFLQGLFAVFKRHNVSPSARHSKMLYQSLLRAYVLIYVHEKPTKQKCRLSVNCSCRDCVPLNEFLSDPLRDITFISVSEKRRLHLEKVLYRDGVDLAVMKQYEMHRGAWLERVKQAQCRLDAFDQDMLRTVLADEFMAIAGLGLVFDGEEPPAARTTPLPSSSKRHRSPAAAFSGTPEEQPSQTNAEIARMAAPCPTAASSSHPPPPEQNPTAIPDGERSAAPNNPSMPYRTTNPVPQPPMSQEPAPRPLRKLLPKPTMLEVSRSISASANWVRMNRSTSARNGSSSRPPPPLSSENPLPRSTVATIPNPIAGTKRKHIEVDVVDLTSED
ncbi:hypothetical protein GGR52DRAFT_319184 [Hypoxylon sp. FL1284]|nr:hypothetical protein GGR52DRAFT_319184 [Hypoxylon sp. FL1284]